MAQELIQLQPGTQVERWTIEKKLGEGGFGAVYRCRDGTGQYALKVEGVAEQIQAKNCCQITVRNVPAGATSLIPPLDVFFFGPMKNVMKRVRSFAMANSVEFNMTQRDNVLKVLSRRVTVLKMEVYVLTELTKRGSRHFCRIEDKGRYGNFNYVVMTLVGKSLQDLNKGGPGGHMTLGCAISCGIQALEALEDLHNIGYLHRDVKPGNYTIGRAELNELRKVYILDFGMCRKFTNDQGIIRKPRQAAGFRGTVRYAPISCHLQRELCRKDDCETWVYMIVEFTYGRLPWREVQDMNQVGEYKKRVRQPMYIMELFPPPCPREYIQILQYIDSLKYYDAPNYQMIYGLMRQALQSSHVQEYPYDWEMGGPTAYLLH